MANNYRQIKKRASSQRSAVSVPTLISHHPSDSPVFMLLTQKSKPAFPEAKWQDKRRDWDCTAGMHLSKLHAWLGFHLLGCRLGENDKLSFPLCFNLKTTRPLYPIQNVLNSKSPNINTVHRSSHIRRKLSPF